MAGMNLGRGIPSSRAGAGATAVMVLPMMLAVLALYLQVSCASDPRHLQLLYTTQSVRQQTHAAD